MAAAKKRPEPPSGAGRPPKGTERVHLRLRPETIELLDERADEHGSRPAADEALILRV